MRLATVACVIAALAAGSSFAASGDPLSVTGSRVNVRSGPGTDNAVVTQVNRDQRVVEIAREGDWVQVEIANSGGRQGWIHSSLVAAATGGEATATQAPEGGGTAMDQGSEVAVPDLAARDAESDLEAAKTNGGAAGSMTATPEVARFKESVSYLNDRALQVAGVDLFTGVEAVAPRTIAVGTTEAWSTVPPAGQRSYLNTLIDRWSAANGGDDEVRVRILDSAGQVLVEESGP